MCCPERVIKEAKVAEEHARKVAEEEKKKQEEKKKEEEAHKHTKEILIPSKAEIDHDLFAEAIRNFQTYLPMETKGKTRIILNNFISVVSLYTPWKNDKICGFLMFSGGKERAVAWNGLSFFAWNLVSSYQSNLFN